MTQALYQIYDTGIIPEDLRHSLIIKLAKKRKAMECTEHRTISLMSHMVKIMLKIILNRNEKKIDNEIGEMQSGFKASVGTREGIFNLREIFDKYLGIKKNVYVCYIDYEKAFDRVYHNDLIETIKQIEIDGKDIRFIQNLYWNQCASIKLREGESNKLQIKRGVRQGCILSPKLFNLYTEEIFRKADKLPGINIGGKNFTNLRYADDTALVAETEEALQEIVDLVNEESAKKGLKMNVKKTKTMVICRNKETPQIEINVDGTNLEQVKQFKYLGQLITEDGKTDIEIRRRIEIARKNFMNMKDTLISRKLSLETKKRLVRCYILSTLLYASETWTISEEAWAKIEAFEMWIYRKMLRIPYTAHMTNKTVLHLAKTTRSIKFEIKQRKIRYFGHIIRANKIQKTLLTGKVEGKRGRGRPRRTWVKDITQWTQRSMTQCVREANNREQWRYLSANLPEVVATNR